MLAGRTPSVISLCEMPLPLFVAWRRHLSPAGGSLSTQVEALAKRVSLVLTGQRQKKSTDKPISFPPQRILHVFWFYYTVFAGGCTAPGAFLSRLYASAKASTFGGGGISRSEMTERVTCGTNPLSLAALDSSPEGRALGKKGNSRPHRSTAEEVNR